MRKIIIVILTSFTAFSFAQEKATDIFNAKAGFIGAWIGYEKALSSDFTLNGELGYEGGFFYSSWVSDKVNFIFTTTLSLEGRYYYNFDRRIEKGKNTKNNSANFIAIEAEYTPDWGTSSNADNVNVLRTFTIIPKYGFKRNLSDKFNFEFSIGPGYQWVEKYDGGIILGFDARFGFVF